MGPFTTKSNVFILKIRKIKEEILNLMNYGRRATNTVRAINLDTSTEYTV